MRPLFEVVTPTATAATRRLTTAAKVRAMIGSLAGDDSKLEAIIDRVSARATKHCKLAIDPVGTVPSFGAEALRATFYPTQEPRGCDLMLPWRVPVTAITSIVEDGVTLAADTDYKLVGGGMVRRFSDGAPYDWSTGKIVVVYAAGWSLPDGVPPDLEEQVIEQVKTNYLGADRDNAIRSETINDVGAWQYAVAGGDSISSSGLLAALESALSQYKDWSQG